MPIPGTTAAAIKKFLDGSKDLNHSDRVSALIEMFFPQAITSAAQTKAITDVVDKGYKKQSPCQDLWKCLSGKLVR